MKDHLSLALVSIDLSCGAELSTLCSSLNEKAPSHAHNTFALPVTTIYHCPEQIVHHFPITSSQLLTCLGPAAPAAQPTRAG